MSDGKLVAVVSGPLGKHFVAEDVRRYLRSVEHGNLGLGIGIAQNRMQSLQHWGDARSPDDHADFLILELFVLQLDVKVDVFKRQGRSNGHV